MLSRASGILKKIHTFLHGIFFSPPPREEDDLPFLDDLSWLKDTEQIRQDALLFWSDESLGRYRSLSEISSPSKFYEKHSTTLSNFDLMTLNAMTGAAEPVEKEPDDIVFEPARPANTGTAMQKKDGTPAAETPRPVMSFVDPLEDLYEPVEAGFVPVWEQKPQPYNDMYSVIMRMSAGKRRDR